MSHYQTLFRNEGSGGIIDIPTGVFTEFSYEDWNILTRPYTTMSDIDHVVHNMGALKAPGLDGFKALFFQKNWNVVAPKVYIMVLSALEGKGRPQSLNETFLVLLM